MTCKQIEAPRRTRVSLVSLHQDEKSIEEMIGGHMRADFTDGRRIKADVRVENLLTNTLDRQHSN
ncbi:hypothetical protein ACTXT7_006566 [Hymenolepis weldensis]